VAERVFRHAIAVAPEHVGGRHHRLRAGLHRALEDGVDIGDATG
jgi:hypothetical protein